MYVKWGHDYAKERECFPAICEGKTGECNLSVRYYTVSALKRRDFDGAPSIN